MCTLYENDKEMNVSLTRGCYFECIIWASVLRLRNGINFAFYVEISIDLQYVIIIDTN